jgi:CheY-like chemotaxis protein
MWETLDSPLPEDRRPTLPGYALVVEDVETVREMLCAQLATSFRCLNLPLRAGNVQGARSALDDKEVRCALVDLVLEDDQSGGIKVIEELAKHSNFKGALVFTERETRRPEIMSLQTRFPKHRLEFCSKPRMGEQHFQLKMNRVMETLWQILQNP